MLVLLAGMVASSVLFAPAASAASVIVVTTTADVVDPNDGLLSLREAVTLSNSQAGDDTIQLASGATYSLTLCTVNEGILFFGDAGTRVTIQGNGSTIDEQCPATKPSPSAALYGGATALLLANVTVSSTSRGVALFYPFDAPSPGLVLDHAAVVGAAHDCVATDGGPATVHVLFSRIDGCGGRGVAMGGSGAAEGQLDILDSDVSGAQCVAQLTSSSVGCAIVAPSVTIVRSAIHDNPGGGPFVSGPASVTDSHIDRNGGSLAGFFSRDLVAVDSTFDDNAASGPNRLPAGVLVNGHTVSMTRVSVSRNTGPLSGIEVLGSPMDLVISDSHVDDNRAVTVSGGVGPNAGIRTTADSVLGSLPTGHAQIERSTANDNTSSMVAGVSAESAVTIVDSTVAGNHVVGRDPTQASGAVVAQGTLMMSGSTVSGNEVAPVDASASTLPSAAVLASTGTLSNSTVSGNTADVGAVFLRTAGSLHQVTVADNAGLTAQALAAAGPVTFDATVLSRGPGGPPTCATIADPGVPSAVGSFASGGYNVVSDSTCPFTAAAGDLVNAGAAGLAPLADNGGATATRLPLPQSVVRDRVPTSAAARCSGVDQRGVARPQGVGCDVGAVEAKGARFHPLPPARILDSRTSGTPGFTSPLVAGSPRSLTVTGGSVPATASAVVMNVTATGSTANSYLTVWPDGVGKPNASAVNFAAGQTIPNLVTVKVGAGGKVAFATNQGSTDVVVDLFGYFDDGTGSGDGWSGIDPARLLDSRTPTGGWNAKLAAGSPRELEVRGVAGIPAEATAIVANVTATGADANSFLTLWPAGAAGPSSSNVNFAAGETIANGVVIPVGAGGMISIANAVGKTDVVLDVTGYFTPAGGSRFFAVAPTRVLDDRVHVGATGPWQPNQTRPVTVTGGPIAANASGVAVNVTVTNATAGSFLSVFPHGTAKPSASSINFGPGQTIANQTMVRVAGGQVDIFNQLGTVDVIADVVGYYAA